MEEDNEIKMPYDFSERENGLDEEDYSEELETIWKNKHSRNI